MWFTGYHTQPTESEHPRLDLESKQCSKLIIYALIHTLSVSKSYHCLSVGLGIQLEDSTIEKIREIIRLYIEVKQFKGK